MNVLFIGDIIGKAGRRALKEGLSGLIDRFNIDLVIANVENVAGGFGITEEVCGEVFSMGINVLTSGNHIWDKRESIPYIMKERRLLRPANYPEGVPGYSSIVTETNLGEKVAVLNIAGRVFMQPLDCPFKTALREIPPLKRETNVIIIDFHAEATSEKSAFAWFLDGKVSAVIGTHTHVQTADERVLPDGTAFITDVGMTGPLNSVIGIKKDLIINRFLTQMPVKFETAKGPSIISCVILDINPDTGKANGIERLQIQV
ncbi:MAG: TIGR00282 family metallophosphoesterase [Thermodesulfovibrionia bacterium]